MNLSAIRSIRFLAALFLAASVAASAWAQGQQGPKGQPSQKGPQQQGKQGPAAMAGPADNYTIEQAVSEQAQLSTIAFSALAFMTGTFGADSFLPPGKAADYFGFQYMRDIDASEAGHNMMFLTNIANDTLAALTDAQKAQFLALAKEQAPLYAELARKRLVLIKAFRDNMEGKAPSAAAKLSQAAVEAWVSSIFEIDGKLAFRRAQAYGAIAKGLSAAQKAALAKLKFGDSSTWRELPDQYDKRSMTHEEDVLFSTYASEFFSWYAGSETADVYFCPERHGTYFGGFYMKDYPAMGNRDYFIPTALTGDSGQSFLDLLTRDQAERIISIMTPLAPILQEIIGIRRSISKEFRKYLAGGAADEALVMKLSKDYGKLDGQLSFLMADRFASVGKTLTDEQRAALVKLRNQDVFPDGYYIYADIVKEPLELESASLFSR
jgi:hypothetical protein